MNSYVIEMDITFGAVVLGAVRWLIDAQLTPGLSLKTVSYILVSNGANTPPVTVPKRTD